MLNKILFTLNMAWTLKIKGQPDGRTTSEHNIFNASITVKFLGAISSHIMAMMAKTGNISRIHLLFCRFLS